MRRIPISVVIVLVPMAVGITWWSGTRHYEFLREPSATEIEAAKLRATSELVRPADLAAHKQAAPDAESTPTPEAAEPLKPKPPLIDISDPTTEPPLDAWTERSDLPAGSFIELASRLESDAHLAWARVTWERVIDLAETSNQDLEVAVKAIARIRASVTPPAETPDDAPRVGLLITAPEDRIELTKRSAEEAADALEQATERTIRFIPEVRVQEDEEEKEEEAVLTVSLTPPSQQDDAIGAVSSEAPSDPDVIRKTILDGAYMLIASSLATSDELKPLSSPRGKESAEDALSHRITRRAWAVYTQESR